VQWELSFVFAGLNNMLSSVISSTVQRPQSSNTVLRYASTHTFCFSAPPLNTLSEKQMVRCGKYAPEVIAVQFWNAWYLEKIQEMKAQRKAELEEAGKL